MPVVPTYPGVYIEELPSAVRTIMGVPTAVGAFIGGAPRGPADDPQHINSWGDYQRAFGGLSSTSPMSYAVYEYYANGGSQAEVVRIVGANAKPATLDLGNKLELTAASPGEWANNNLRARVEYRPKTDRDKLQLWHLTLRDVSTGTEERYLNISNEAASPQNLVNLAHSSALIRVDSSVTIVPEASGDVEAGTDPFAAELPAAAAAGGGKNGGAGEGGNGGAAGGGNPGKGAAAKPPYVKGAGGMDGDKLDMARYLGSEAEKKGLYALLKTDIFNMLVISPLALDTDLPDGVLSAAAALCERRRAILLVDPPSSWTSVQTVVGDVMAGKPLTGDVAKNAVLYFPRITVPDPDPAMSGRPLNLPPSGAVAGVWARTDGQRGVWKAPAGQDASLAGVSGLTVSLSDDENGQLNPIAVNCLRTFPIIGPVVWGARTLRGADIEADQWKYLPVRRLALYIEESLYRGTKWVVFEPNDEPLWSSIRLNVGTFMNNLFRQGAFQGATPREAYLVKCDRENNPQADIDRGIVNILVGFAPLKPAEFVFH